MRAMAPMMFRVPLLLLVSGLLAHPAAGAVHSALMEKQIRPKRSDDVSSLEITVDDHSQQLTDVTARLAALETRMNTAELNIAFHAYHSSDPFNVASQGTIIYDITTTNTGSAYDTRTGVFTAPVSGTYMFFLTCMATYGTTEEPQILLEGRVVARCHSNMVTERTSELGSTFTIVSMQAGNQVWIRLSENSEDVRGRPWNTFAGFLLKVALS